jgi:hypothetical protein
MNNQFTENLLLGRPGEPYIEVNTAKLPPGSVIPDNVPPGHVSVNNVPVIVIQDAVGQAIHISVNS